MSGRASKRNLLKLDCRGTGNYQVLIATSVFCGVFIPLFFILKEYGYGSLDASAYAFLVGLGILLAFWFVFFFIVPSMRKPKVEEDQVYNTLPSSTSYIVNILLLIFGTVITLAALIVFTSWHLWGYIIAAPVIFILWHLLIDRFLSGITNRLFEKD